MLLNMYLESALNIKLETKVLSELEGNNLQSATKTVEEFLRSDVVILEGCKYDLCKNESYKKISEALDEAQSYLARYSHDNS